MTLTPEQAQARAHSIEAVLTTLCERWEQMAAVEETSGEKPLLDDAYIYRRAAKDVRHVLRTGRIPHDLITDTEHEQHSSREEATP